MKTRDQPPAMPPPEKDEFLRRWSRRKLESETAPLVNSEPVGEEGPELATPPGDEDMPAISSLNEESDYSGFSRSGSARCCASGHCASCFTVH